METKFIINKSLPKYISEFREFFELIEFRVKRENKSGKFGLGKDLETLLIPFFDHFFNAKFIQEERINAAAIDLISHNKIAIQVTSNKNKSKIIDTLKTIFKNNIHGRINKIYFIYLQATAPKFEDTIASELESILTPDELENWNNFSFSLKESTIDFNTIVEKLCTHENIGMLPTYEDYLKNIVGVSFKSVLNDKTSINDKIKFLSIEEAGNYLNNYFCPILILPAVVFGKLKLFDDFIGIKENTILHTSNFKLFNHLKEIVNITEHSLLRFLSNNRIQIIVLNRNPNKSIFINKAKQANNSKLIELREFVYVAQNRIESSLDKNNYNLYLQNLIILLEINERERALNVFIKIFDYLKKEPHEIKCFHIIYLFNKFFIFENSNKFNKIVNKYREFIEYYSSVNFLSNATYSEAEELVNFYHNYNNVENQFRTLELIESFEILFRNDKNGISIYESSVKNITEKIFNYIFDIYTVNHINSILFDPDYSNAKLVLKRLVELLLKCSSLKNPDLKQTIVINDTLLQIFLRELSPDDFYNLLVRYNRKSYLLSNEEFKNSTHRKCMILLENIITLQTGRKVNFQNYTSFISGVVTKINNVLQNIVKIYLVLNFNNDYINELVSHLLRLFFIDNLLYPITYHEFSLLFNERQVILNSENIKNIKELQKKFPHLLVEFKFIGYNSDIRDLSAINASDIIRKCFIYDKIQITPKIKRDFKTVLDQELQYIDVFNGILLDLIDYKDYILHLEKYLLIRLEYYQLNQNNFFYKTDFFSALNEFIEILYCINDSSLFEKYKMYCPEKDYFRWLFNLSNFDYTKFHPFWILNYKSVFYFNEFAKHGKIKSAIEIYLKDNHLPLLSEVYFKHFI